jgi:hypothetical protein
MENKEQLNQNLVTENTPEENSQVTAETSETLPNELNPELTTASTTEQLLAEEAPSSNEITLSDDEKLRLLALISSDYLPEATIETPVAPEKKATAKATKAKKLRKKNQLLLLRQ